MPCRRLHHDHVTPGQAGARVAGPLGAEIIGPGGEVPGHAGELGLADLHPVSLDPVTYLTAYLDECGRHGGKPLSGEALARFLPWNASPEDLRTLAQPPPNGKTPD